MTPDSTHLGSMSSLIFPMYVKTTDGTPLSVISCGTLRAPQFHVPSVSHVSQLLLQLFFSARLLIMVVVSFLILMLVLSMIITPGPWLVQVVSFVIHLVFGSLTGFIFM
jgi:hypothetical protein